MPNSLEAATDQVILEFLAQSASLASVSQRPRDDDATLALPAIVVSTVEKGTYYPVKYQGRYGSELEITVDVMALYRPAGILRPSRAQLTSAQFDEIIAAVEAAFFAPDPARCPTLTKFAHLTWLEKVGEEREEDNDRRTRKLQYLFAGLLR